MTLWSEQDFAWIECEIVWSGSEKYVSLVKPGAWTQKESPLLRAAPAKSEHITLEDSRAIASAASPVDVGYGWASWKGEPQHDHNRLTRVTHP